MEEIKSIEKINTWELVNLTERKETIDVKWTFKMKIYPEGTISKHKARLVVNEFPTKIWY